MSAGESVVIFGASVRAAAFSALRAGLRPWCADLFADFALKKVLNQPTDALTQQIAGGHIAVADRV